MLVPVVQVGAKRSGDWMSTAAAAAYLGVTPRCVLCLLDENNERLFQPEDEFPLGGKSAAALDRIFTVAQRLNGLRDEDVSELAKNSNAGQRDALPSD